jgi:acetoin utilization deacetylase AcuC-like enzyme
MTYEDSAGDSDSSSPIAAPIHNFGFCANIDERLAKRIKLDDDEAYGLEDDCPIFAELSEYVKEIAGASLTAARELRDGRADIAVAWTGGRFVYSSHQIHKILKCG